jgi:hypothetical protein
MNMPSLKDNVLREIRARRVHMRPRMFFVAQVLAIDAGALCAFFVAVFFISFVLFALRESGAASLLRFGSRGLAVFFSVFPWLTIGFVAVLVVAIEWLLRKFTFGYRAPILRVFAGVVAFTIVASVLLALSPLHRALLDRADNDALPVLGEMYESVHASHRDAGIFRGVVTSVATSSFVISHNDFDRDADDGTWTVMPPAGAGVGSTVQLGEKVYIAGDVEGGIIRAYGIQQLPD